jgi:hypothetical protein
MSEPKASNKFRETVTSGTGHFKAVCHKCHYVGFEPNHNRCAYCGFPIILEPHESAQVALREIFDRSSVELGVNIKAPPLPGVDPQKRKAQLLAEARRRLRGQSQRMAAASAPAAIPVAIEDEDEPATGPMATPVTASASPAAYQPAAYQVVTQAVAPRPVTHHPASRPVAHPVSRPRAHEPAGGARLATSQVALPMSPGRARLGMTLAFISAIIAGVALAAANSGF